MTPTSGKQPLGDRLVKLTATFFGIGLSGWAPGTMGSVAGVLIAWFAGPAAPALLLFFIALGFIIAKPATRVLNSGDPSSFVLDEVCGMMLALTLVPKDIYLFGAGFILFRFFDILKPWPISLIQKSKRPAAILWDDLAAGLFANVLIQLYLILKS